MEVVASEETRHRFFDDNLQRDRLRSVPFDLRHLYSEPSWQGMDVVVVSPSHDSTILMTDMAAHTGLLRLCFNARLQKSKMLVNPGAVSMPENGTNCIIGDASIAGTTSTSISTACEVELTDALTLAG
ncbi:MAG TPA: hypothetical protein VKJ45_23430 [Blastocatellia bacterium]|nr:hypothetical protein [Blastocatellia bacterium]